MIEIEDFTTMEIGREIALEGRVGTCPRCGRGGVIKRRRKGFVDYLHVQISHMLADGLLTIPQDRCRIPQGPPSPAKPTQRRGHHGPDR